MSPPSEDQFRAFLLPLAAAVRRMGAPDRGEFDLFARAAEIACCDLDAQLLSPAAQLAALRRFEEWPSVAELRRFLGLRACRLGSAQRIKVFLLLFLQKKKRLLAGSGRRA